MTTPLDEVRRGGGGTGLGPDDDVVADDSVVAVGVSDGVDDRLRERPRGGVAGALAGHGGLGDLPEHLVVDVVVEDLLIDGFLGEFGGLGVALDDGGRVDVVLEQVLGLRELVR